MLQNNQENLGTRITIAISQGKNNVVSHAGGGGGEKPPTKVRGVFYNCLR